MKDHPIEKAELHPRNRHRERYDFKALTETTPGLAKYVKINPYQDESIDFFDPEAVKMLNRALLRHHYGITYWDIPKGYLCPPIPGRADYLHHIADLLAESNGGEVPTGDHIRCLDIGTGANCVYPIIGSREYGWAFTGTDIDSAAIDSARKIVESNPMLKKLVTIKFQRSRKDTFANILLPEDRIAITVCNPPFHSSAAEAMGLSQKKVANLKQQGKPGGKPQPAAKPVQNFGGTNTELWCEGGEEQFIRGMVKQSQKFGGQVCWFSTLVAKSANLPGIYEALTRVEAAEVRTLPMGTGNKLTRVVAWTFMTAPEREAWMKAQ